jgi:hypothetical protein
LPPLIGGRLFPVCPIPARRHNLFFAGLEARKFAFVLIYENYLIFVITLSKNKPLCHYYYAQKLALPAAALG